MNLPLIRICAFVCLLGGGLQPLAAQTYQWFSSLTAPAANGWCLVDLTPDVLSGLRADFADLRLVEIQGPDTVEVPYFLKTWTDDSVWIAADFEEINEGDRRENAFMTYRVGEEYLVNRVRFDIDAQTYDLQVMLEGSANRIRWQDIVVSKKLRGETQEKYALRQEVLDFDSVRYKFFRIQYTPGEIPVKIKSLGFFEFHAGRTARYPVKHFQDVEVPADNTTVVSFDLGQRLPLNLIQLKVSGTRDFFREGTLFVATDTAASGEVNWARVKDFAISSLNNPTIELPLTFGRHWKAVIRHEDNLPIRIGKIEVSAPAYSLLADLRRGGVYGLKFGANAASKPRYDVSRLIAELDLTKLPSLRAGSLVSILPEGAVAEPPAIGPQALFQPAALNPWYIGGGVAVLIILLLVVRHFFRSLKSKSSKQTPKDPS